MLHLWGCWFYRICLVMQVTEAFPYVVSRGGAGGWVGGVTAPQDSTVLHVITE